MGAGDNVYFAAVVSHRLELTKRESFFEYLFHMDDSTRAVNEHNPGTQYLK
jgi:hypothetical protein